MPTNVEPGRVVALMGSYRKGGTIDTVVDEVLRGAGDAGARTEKIELLDQHVEFCKNCRDCCCFPGPERGRCLQHTDDLDAILTALEEADAIVLGAPVNFGDVNALTRRLLERMIGYGYWPPDKGAPTFRRRATKPAVLITSAAAPSLLTRWSMRPLRTLKQMAKLIGARPVDTLVVGLAGARGREISERVLRRARNVGHDVVHMARAHAPGQG